MRSNIQYRQSDFAAVVQNSHNKYSIPYLALINIYMNIFSQVYIYIIPCENATSNLSSF